MRQARAAGLPLLVVLINMAQIAYSTGGSLGKPAIAQVVIIVIGAAALMARHRYPRSVAVVTTLCGTALPIIAPHQVVVDVATVVALYTVAVTTDRRTTVILGAVAATLLTVSSMLWLPHHLLNIRNVLPLNYIAVAAAVGDAVRNQRTLLRQERRRTMEAEHTRESQSRLRVREERIRIARELHDVVAHHLTLVNAQAAVAHHLLRTDPERAYQALGDIKQTSRDALDELRATVGLLRDDDEPESRQPVPSFAELDTLLDSFRKAGLDLQLTRQGTPQPLTGSADLAAYRIVQEALTNASKHGPTAHAALDLTYTEQALHITVTNPATPGHRGPGTGHGMIGMRERAESAGGRFTTSSPTEEIFGVEVSLPLTTNNQPAA
ncbi:histidine kinase [Paractinoplanes ferrugineus]|uniref:histidine kinase n=1 Tax=Paractinoplanes ferrugineus TaxID=113564 RepID=A0A919J686_9ACTN|nr:sensor histidine kinase [Actinoplanes ferrugineus]GIE14067.1 two-component sensor histidine kinase [Actinoplanes ferrugineus]